MVYWLQPCAIIDLTMGNGAWAVIALKQGLPYFGVALTEAHHQEVLAHLKVQAGIAESLPVECNADFAYGALLLFLERKNVFVTPPEGSHHGVQPGHGGRGGRQRWRQRQVPRQEEEEGHVIVAE